MEDWRNDATSKTIYLLELKRRIAGNDFDMLELSHLDPLRNEVEVRLQELIKVKE